MDYNPSAGQVGDRSLCPARIPLSYPTYQGNEKREVVGRRLLTDGLPRSKDPVARGTAEMGWGSVVIHHYGKACERCEGLTQRYGLSIV